MQAHLSAGSALVLWIALAAVIGAAAIGLLLAERLRTAPPPVRRHHPGGRRAASDPRPLRRDGYVTTTEPSDGSWDFGSSDSGGGDSGGGGD